MKNRIYKWRKYGVLRNKYHGDSWYARYEASNSNFPYVEEFKYFKDRKDRDNFILEQNRIIKLYGDDEYYELYRTLMK